VLQAGVEDFLDAAQFVAPELAHIVEAAIDAFEALIHADEAFAELSVHTFELGINVGH
jgi:hypothetical protein